MTTTKRRLPSVISVRNAFIRALTQALPQETIKEINRLNAIHPDKPCATLKFCDANALMAEAFHSLGIDTTLTVADADYDEETELKKSRLWTAAWSQAKALGFSLRGNKDLAYLLIKNPPKTIEVMELVDAIGTQTNTPTPHLGLIKQDMQAAVETVEFDCEELTLFSLRHPQLIHQEYVDHWARAYVRKAASTPLGAHQVDCMARELKDRCGNIELGATTYYFESELPELGTFKILNNIKANRKKIDNLHKDAVSCLNRRSARAAIEFETKAGLPPGEFHTQWQAKNYARLAASLGSVHNSPFSSKTTRQPRASARG